VDQKPPGRSMKEQARGRERARRRGHRDCAVSSQQSQRRPRCRRSSRHPRGSRLIIRNNPSRPIGAPVVVSTRFVVELGSAVGCLDAFAKCFTISRLTSAKCFTISRLTSREACSEAVAAINQTAADLAPTDGPYLLAHRCHGAEARIRSTYTKRLLQSGASGGTRSQKLSQPPQGRDISIS